MLYDSKFSKLAELKNELDKYRPLKPDVLKQLKEYFRIGLTYTSNAVEGNTLTESETKVVIEDGITIAGKPVNDHMETLGHSDAYDEICELAKKRGFAEQDILKLHRLFYHRINENEAGHYRKTGVVITGTDYIPPPAAKVPSEMERFVKELQDLRNRLHPVELAAHVHLELANIHPFVDGNGRVERLLMNLVLLQNGYPIAIIPPVVRADYITALVKTNHGNSVPFFNFISCMAYETMKDYIRIIKQM
ncbi:MAG: cell filamentation protein Fic [Deltaproteobacteria bacterium CG11_big_fil_rev_8_21_14_0_20_49_13]|nr:MAG: cell filamentation protein Fic [Deltaproteobacteria bacterium CG11_big_fil_rev_8_21_14_0_20_49_13]